MKAQRMDDRNDTWKILVINCYEILLIALLLGNLFDFCVLFYLFFLCVCCCCCFVFSFFPTFSGVFEDNNIDGCERAAGPRSGVEISCFSQSEETLCLLDSDNLSRRR